MYDFSYLYGISHAGLADFSFEQSVIENVIDVVGCHRQKINPSSCDHLRYHYVVTYTTIMYPNITIVLSLDRLLSRHATSLSCALSKGEPYVNMAFLFWV